MATIYSHPPDDGVGKLLRDHLKETALRVGEVVPEDASTPNEESVADLSRRTALVHDIAKATSFFQEYLMDGNESGPKHHSLLGSFVADYVLEKSGYDETERLAGFLAVAKHHGSLPDAGRYIVDRYSPGADYGHKKRWEEMQKQVRDISSDDEARELVDGIIDEATDGEGGWEEFAKGLLEEERFVGLVRSVGRHGNSTPDGLYETKMQVWSALVLADKTDAAGIDADEYSAEHLYPDVLESHIESLPDGDGERERELNSKREKARQEVVGNVANLVEGSADVGTITLPTGLGKTYTGINTAMEARDRKDGEGRVIYALPFTSIIDQVVDEVTDVFDIDVTGKKLTVHHHLAETVTETDGNTDERADEEYTLGESWRSGTVITTFVQLFESLAGPGNTQSMKLPALYNSVVILDEPQALPHRWWGLAGRLVRVLTEEYGATVLAMTATQPRIFEHGEMKTTALVDNVDDYFVDAERVEYVFHDSVDEFLPSEGDGDEEEGVAVDYRKAARTVVASDASSVLAVCNTIDSAEELSDEVENAIDAVSVNEKHGENLEAVDTVGETVEAVTDEVERQDATAVAHLTTRMRPKDRLDVINVAKKLTDDGVPLVVVSTQLIEAGVDISFEAVYRDFAPMDSIVQAAGRCNRSFESERGEVVVWWLAAPEGKERTPSKAVYDFGDSLLPVAGESIDEAREADERGLRGKRVSRDAVERYYEKLRDKRVGDESLVDLLEDAKAEQLGKESLIDTVRSVDVIVCRTKEEEETVDEIKEARENDRYDKAGALLNETKEIRVSVPLYTDEDVEAVEGLSPVAGEDYPDLRFLKTASQEAPKFDTERGLKIENDSVDDRFL
jgi:CRISPR-associated helicase Cas3/CRISPR-associated endonuclease Cas3-HD